MLPNCSPPPIVYSWHKHSWFLWLQQPGGLHQVSLQIPSAKGAHYLLQPKLLEQGPKKQWDSLKLEAKQLLSLFLDQGSLPGGSFLVNSQKREIDDPANPAATL